MIIFTVYYLMVDGGKFFICYCYCTKQNLQIANYTTDVSLKVLRWQVNIRAWIWIFKSVCKLLETDVVIRRARPRLLIEF